MGSSNGTCIIGMRFHGMLDYVSDDEIIITMEVFADLCFHVFFKLSRFLGGEKNLLRFF